MKEIDKISFLIDEILENFRRRQKTIQREEDRDIRLKIYEQILRDQDELGQIINQINKEIRSITDQEGYSEDGIPF